MQDGTKFVICGAGRSTVDISAWSVTNSGLDFEELNTPSCEYLMVSARFGLRVRGRLGCRKHTCGQRACYALI